MAKFLDVNEPYQSGRRPAQKRSKSRVENKMAGGGEDKGRPPISGIRHRETEPEQELNITDAAADLAKELGVDTASLKGSGEGGRITVGDVRKASEKASDKK